jgi:CheY-like chemotaxis protein
MNPNSNICAHPAARATRTVMVVNGPEAILDLFESVLAPGHYDVVVVESADRAYSHIKSIRPDLVILCVRMRDPNSLQVLSMLKLDPETADVPVETFPVEDDSPQQHDDLVDVPDGVFWQQSAAATIQRN